MNFDDALEEFGKAIGLFKRAYAQESNENVDDLMIIIEKNNYINIFPTSPDGRFIVCCRELVKTD